MSAILTASSTIPTGSIVIGLRDPEFEEAFMEEHGPVNVDVKSWITGILTRIIREA